MLRLAWSSKDWPQPLPIMDLAGRLQPERLLGWSLRGRLEVSLTPEIHLDP